jgi:hypothetical protein
VKGEALNVLRSRETHTKDRKRLPRWLVWLPLGALLLLLLLAIALVFLEVEVPLGPGHSITLAGVIHPPNPTMPPGLSLDGGAQWRHLGGTTQARGWQVSLGGRVMYWVLEVRQKQR